MTPSPGSADRRSASVAFLAPSSPTTAMTIRSGRAWSYGVIPSPRMWLLTPRTSASLAPTVITTNIAVNTDKFQVTAATGNVGIDAVAGPIGETLIMTALGLAVAIPAVLGYNALVRGNKFIIARMNRFAHDLHAYFVTGARVHSNAAARV